MVTPPHDFLDGALRAGLAERFGQARQVVHHRHDQVIGVGIRVQREAVLVKQGVEQLQLAADQRAVAREALRPGEGWELYAAGQWHNFDQIVLCCGAFRAAPLLASLEPVASEMLGSFPFTRMNTSTAVG